MENKFEQMAELHDQIITAEKIEMVEDLMERWHSLGIGLWEDEFDVEQFKALLRDTVPILHEFAYSIMPIELVSLLLEIKQFQECPQIDEDSGLAIHIARYLCDTKSFCNVDCEESDDSGEERFLVEVWGNTELHKIYIDSLDFSELKNDIDL